MDTAGCGKTGHNQMSGLPQCLQSLHYHGPLAKVTNAKFGENDTDFKSIV